MEDDARQRLEHVQAPQAQPHDQGRVSVVAKRLGYLERLQRIAPGETIISTRCIVTSCFDYSLEAFSNVPNRLFDLIRQSARITS